MTALQNYETSDQISKFLEALTRATPAKQTIGKGFSIIPIPKPPRFSCCSKVDDHDYLWDARLVLYKISDKIDNDFPDLEPLFVSALKTFHAMAKDSSYQVRACHKTRIKTKLEAIIAAKKGHDWINCKLQIIPFTEAASKTFSDVLPAAKKRLFLIENKIKHRYPDLYILFIQAVKHLNILISDLPREFQFTVTYEFAQSDPDQIRIVLEQMSKARKDADWISEQLTIITRPKQKKVLLAGLAITQQILQVWIQKLPVAYPDLVEPLRIALKNYNHLISEFPIYQVLQDIDYLYIQQKLERLTAVRKGEWINEELIVVSKPQDDQAQIAVLDGAKEKMQALLEEVPKQYPILTKLLNRALNNYNRIISEFPAYLILRRGEARRASGFAKGTQALPERGSLRKPEPCIPGLLELLEEL